MPCTALHNWQHLRGVFFQARTHRRAEADGFPHDMHTKFIYYLFSEILTMVFCKSCALSGVLRRKIHMFFYISCYLFAPLHPWSKWWRHQMETFSALLAICAGNTPVTGAFPAQRPVARSCFWKYLNSFCFSTLDFYHIWSPGNRLDIKIPYYQCTDSHYKDKTISRPSNLYKENSHTWKGRIYSEKGPRLRICLSVVVRLPAFTASARRRLDSFTQFYRRHLILISITTTSCLTGDLVLGGWNCFHYRDVIMGAITSQITSLTIVYSTVYSDADQRKHQSSASLAFVRGIHRGPVNSPHKWPVTRKKFPFDDVIMRCCLCMCISLTLMLCRCLERCFDLRTSQT